MSGCAAMADVLAIIGSVRFACPQGLTIARQLIHNELRDRLPDGVVSGGAVGVDTIGAEVARLLGIDPVEHLPKFPRWQPDGFKARNLLIVRDCTRLLAVRCAESNTYGSGWTFDRAKEQGRPVRRVIIARDGGLIDSGWREPAPRLI